MEGERERERFRPRASRPLCFGRIDRSLRYLVVPFRVTHIFSDAHLLGNGHDEPETHSREERSRISTSFERERKETRKKEEIFGYLRFFES